MIFFCDLRVLARKLAIPFGHPTQVSSQVQLASTCRSVWPGLKILKRKKFMLKTCKYIPLTNRVLGPYRKLRTEVFSSSIYGPSAKRAGHKSKGETRGSVTYSTDRENEVSKIFIISLPCAWGAQKRFLFTRNGFKFRTHLESEIIQFEIVFKSLARFNT